MQSSLGDLDPLSLGVYLVVYRYVRADSLSAVGVYFFSLVEVAVSLDSTLGLLTSDGVVSLSTEVLLEELYCLSKDELGDVDFLDTLDSEVFESLVNLELYLYLVDVLSVLSMFLDFGDEDRTSFSATLSVRSTFVAIFDFPVSSLSAGILSKESPPRRVLVLDPVLNGGEMGGACTPPPLVDCSSGMEVSRGDCPSFFDEELSISFEAL